LEEGVGFELEERSIAGLPILPFLCDVYGPPPRMITVHKESQLVMVEAQILLDHESQWPEQMMGHIL
jgi:hypothetical protein